MLRTFSAFFALFTSVFALMLGSGLQGTLLSLRMTVEGMPKYLTGLVMSCFYAGLILGSFICPKLVRRVGHIRAFAAFGALNTAAALLHALHVSALTWGALRVVTGFSMMGLYMVVESWLNERSEPSTRGRVFSLYMSLTFFGLGLGQFMLNLGRIEGQGLFILTGVFFALCLVPISLTRAVHPELPEVTYFSSRRLFADAPFSIIGCTVAGLNAGAFYSLAPIFAHEMGFSSARVAQYMGVAIISGLVLQWPVGTLSDKLPRRRVLAVLSLGVAAASLATVNLAERSPELLLVLAALYGGVAFTLYPVAIAHANDHIAPSDMVPASAALILFYGCGAFAGPISASALMSAVGPSGVYLFIALCTLLLGTSAWFYREKAKVPTAEQAHCIPVPRTSPVASVLDPRGESEEDSSPPQSAPPT